MIKPSENAGEAIRYLESVALPIFETESESEECINTPAQPDLSKRVSQTVAVGSQIASFAEGFEPTLRPAISNAFLIAQLAADKLLEDEGGDTDDWYNKYVEVLGGIGMISENAEETFKEITGTSTEVHKEILPVLTGLLGPAMAGATALISVLEGLQNMDKDAPWITLFDKRSQRARANQFQISHAETDEKALKITLAAFALNAEKSVTRVLFFRFAASEARLRHMTRKLSVNHAAFTAAAPIIEERLGQATRDFIADIAI
ncbi:MAG: hypothetical protein AAGI88_12980 [Pseudomonadota bacterium]